MPAALGRAGVWVRGWIGGFQTSQPDSWTFRGGNGRKVSLNGAWDTLAWVFRSGKIFPSNPSELRLWLVLEEIQQVDLTSQLRKPRPREGPC